MQWFVKFYMRQTELEQVRTYSYTCILNNNLLYWIKKNILYWRMMAWDNKCNKKCNTAQLNLTEFNLILLFSLSFQFRIPLPSIDPRFGLMLFSSQTIDRVHWLFGSDSCHVSCSLVRKSFAIISCMKEVSSESRSISFILSSIKFKVFSKLHAVYIYCITYWLIGRALRAPWRNYSLGLSK